LDQLAAVLVAGLAVQREADADDGYLRTWRPVPSAGGRHPIDVLVVGGEIDGLDAGAWWFDAWSSELIRETAVDVGTVLRAVGDALVTGPPPVALVAVATPARTLDRYPLGMSLLWRDAGALLQTLHLLAADIGLGSCIVGTAGIAMHTDRQVDVGALAIGRPV
jgi:SagB-type dehydrogenase family enzyme